jgi:Patatin-like phospholipase
MKEDAMDDPRVLECDLIMKGGITSGLVYPGAIARLAQDYRIRSIGGTSAGAIAAAGAAAMEYGIASGEVSLPDALARMLALASEAGAATCTGSSLLESLFTADGPFQKPFDLVKQRLRGPGSGPRGLAFAKAVLDAAPPLLPAYLLATIGAGLGAAVVLGLALAGPLGMPHWLAFTATAVLGFGLMAWALLRGLADAVSELADRWREQGWGLATGMAKPGPNACHTQQPSLTTWLHSRFQHLADLPETEPLTFGQLWKVGTPAAGARSIDLVLVSTDLNRMLSVQFPFLPANQRLFFDHREWAALFPPEILAALDKSCLRPASINQPQLFKTKFGYDVADVKAAAHSAEQLAGLRLLPKGCDMPILVAVRASMAFPGLFTPVPLWLLHWVGSGRDRRPVLDRVLLSDGGITSNFPIHLFDTPLPSRPTFAINLVYPDDQITEEPRRDGLPAQHPMRDETAAPRVVVQLQGGGDAGPANLRQDLLMPLTNSGMVQLYKQVPHGTALGRVSGFAMRVVEAARTWGDVSQYNQPGVRDRIIHIRLSNREGGFNLGMDMATIAGLNAKGAMAGDVLARRFDPLNPDDPLNPGLKLRLNWHNHRFVRLRAYLAAQQLAGSRLQTAWQHANQTGEPQSNPALSAMVTMANSTMPPGGQGHFIGYSSTLTKAQRTLMLKQLDALSNLKPASPAASALAGAPRPLSMVRLRPASADPRDSQP